MKESIFVLHPYRCIHMLIQKKSITIYYVRVRVPMTDQSTQFILSIIWYLFLLNHISKGIIGISDSTYFLDGLTSWRLESL